ncbi:ROK family transcriptional regulator [Streptomyces acidiscabies]|uniref:ROK family transcriptional regulator n=4 Tax=Streptomyces acidiscabies TaxID=42234 RepID=A0AAP6EGJ8_9ACTN|nr:ROK family transcriptional regulator [Streptomyces acidiscabies]MBZ3916283.1 ROK family transcriptional regulator [Streptomyces acidiscabies]MDX2962043.1 ROK family transcriptional regulator [Streptomyces acidiscabies]MDX3017960.1 ROK family transcriptional regulator [Streptomyces acidiscabies]MDX3791267.1 ROK family transcriptional regulator [Streptomyces acidiscabies]
MARHTARDLRGENRFAVLHALFDLGPSSRQELARHTGLSQATVTTLVGEFLAEGVLVIAARERGGVGRPYERLAIDPDRGRIVGVDVAETYVVATVYDLTLGVLGQGEVALDEHENAQGYVVDGIVSAIGIAVDAGGVGRERIVGVGVSMPGHVHPETGVSVFAPNWDWHDVRIEELLAARLELPVHVDNPLKAVALSEMWFGVGRSVDSMAVVNLGTGVGAGIALGGSLIRGTTNNAGEWGHTLLELDGRPCRCGRRGCVEAYVGAAGLEATLAAIAPDHPALRRRGQRDFVVAVADGLAAGDPVVEELLARTAHYLAAALGDLVNLLNVPTVTLTGWMSRALADRLVPAVREELPRHVLPGSLPGLTVQASPVPGNAVALGMAAFTLERFLERLGLASPARARVQ